MITRTRFTRAVAAGAGALLLAVGLAVPLAATPASPVEAAPACTLSNPISNGADPSVWFRDNTYYLAQSDGDRSITLKASSTLNGLSSARAKTIFTAPVGTDHSAQTWAPELEYLDGRWYVYYAAATERGSFDATNDTHRLFAIRADTQDPMGTWTFAGKIADSTDQWAIDGTVFRYQDSWWLLWSGTPTGNGGRAPQQIYIARMSSPLTIDQDHRRLIGNPDQTWETSRAAIMEGPEAWISPNGTLSIVYNANASWTTEYALGLLVYKGGDLTDYRSYTKRGPVFSSGGGVYGPGGESIPVPGKNGVNWNVYHAKTTTADGWDDRKIFAQPVPWAADGTPAFGTPTGFAGYNEALQQRC
ncbi:GH43 family beta-xylosidase [Frigoribacterium sp. PvP054]|uniref:glycoside hydrolase family 43 protein n=1 Tax=Frigoribacterium sp. PvP054 TaxID=3156438 RepID=UPI003395BAD7